MNQRLTATESQGLAPRSTAAEARAGGHRPGLFQLGAALVCLLAAAGLLSWKKIQWMEASTASWMLRHLGAGGEAIRSVLLVRDSTRHDVPGVPPGGYVSGGFAVAASCSVSMFLGVLLVAAAVLFATGRVPIRRAVPVLAAIAGLFVVVSQLRLVVSGWIIHAFGQADGYPIAHVLVGTVISTLGLVLGLAAFVTILLRRPADPPSGPTRLQAPLRPNQSPEPVTTGEP